MQAAQSRLRTKTARQLCTFVVLAAIARRDQLYREYTVCKVAERVPAAGDRMRAVEAATPSIEMLACSIRASSLSCERHNQMRTINLVRRGWLQKDHAQPNGGIRKSNLCSATTNIMPFSSAGS